MRRPYQVAAVRQERGNCWSLTLEAAGHKGMDHKAGQFAWLKLWGSPFGISYHPFSLTSSAERAGQIQFTIKELGDWTSRLGEVQVGQRAYVDGPYGIFGPEFYDASGYVFLAGGIGIAPFMGMLRTFADRDDQRPVVLFYGNPTWESIAHREELAALQERLNLEVVHVLERPPEGWTGETGFITARVIERHLLKIPSDAPYMMCGPLPMIDALEGALRQLEIPRTQIHSERYEMA
jgi:predicted ferric reductase